MLRRTAASTVSNLANFATINLKDDARQAGQVMVRPSTPPEAVPGGRHARSRLHWRRFARGRMGVVASAVKSIGITVVRGMPTSTCLCVLFVPSMFWGVACGLYASAR
jgi:hypothetical protein